MGGEGRGAYGEGGEDVGQSVSPQNSHRARSCRRAPAFAKATAGKRALRYKQNERTASDPSAALGARGGPYKSKNEPTCKGGTTGAPSEDY